MVDISNEDVKGLSARLDKVESYLHIDEKRGRVAELELESAQPGFWDDAERATKAMEELTRAKEDVSALDNARAELDDVSAALELGLETSDEELLAEAKTSYDKLVRDLGELELSTWFTGEFDHGDAIVTVTPGQGGLEAQDWCDMLFHMYLRYCDRRGWKVDVNDAPAAEVIGIDRATFTVSGKNAYGMLRAEQGVHRLVRISPTDDKKRRQTTFAGVEVLPVLPDDVTVDIDPGDIRVDVYHATGHGGQGVNTTDSAVRITHIPTGIVVTCQNERSQIQNRAIAMGILKSRLYERALAERESEVNELRGPKREIGFGNQIRSYVLYPYKMVKDLRTGVETGNVDAVLRDGDLDQFIIGYHRWRTSEEGK
ncbi:MAG: peptide chain release factor 2 [Parafannyhessea sp.]|uniref:peptide chain release factor 2 n=1 Tax=Parafannyhessea sp. TaxID=2847324 RepID=UPI003F1210AB